MAALHWTAALYGSRCEMREQTASISTRLQCPACKAPLPATLSCGACARSYERIEDTPVLIDFPRSIVSNEAIRKLAPERQKKNAGGLGARLNRITYGTRSELMKTFLNALTDYEIRHEDADLNILLIGGGTKGPGEEVLESNPRYVAFRTDIYLGANVDIVCDGHDLPFRDDTFDAVICQAVLEHVLDPQRVVDEIHRVLRPGGLVAAGTPFLQAVHAGAYDFTRFTLSGHRWLFRRFDEIASGIRGGPGLSALWSLRVLARGLGLGPKGALITTSLFAWLNRLDSAVARRWREDGANGVWFVGRRREGSMSPRDMVAYYEDRRKLVE